MDDVLGLSVQKEKKSNKNPFHTYSADLILVFVFISNSANGLFYTRSMLFSCVLIFDPLQKNLILKSRQKLNNLNAAQYFQNNTIRALSPKYHQPDHPLYFRYCSYHYSQKPGRIRMKTQRGLHIFPILHLKPISGQELPSCLRMFETH